jgi:aminobenzoyl-glutamate utilization protein B
MRFPSNISGTPGHHWANAIAMATPIAHKGVVCGSKVVATTVLDMLTNPRIIADAWEYHNQVQTKDVKYTSFVEKDTPPAIFLNKRIMEQFRPDMKKYYYDPKKYNTYLDQLGIKYPTLQEKE